MALFFILAMVLGTATVYLVAQGILPTRVALASVLSSSIAGVIMTAVEDGREGPKLMLRRLMIWRDGIRILAICVADPSSRHTDRFSGQSYL